MLVKVLDEGRLAPFADPGTVDDLAAPVARIAHIRELSGLDTAFTYPFVKEFFLYAGNVYYAGDGCCTVFAFFQEADDRFEEGFFCFMAGFTHFSEAGFHE